MVLTYYLLPTAYLELRREVVQLRFVATNGLHGPLEVRVLRLALHLISCSIVRLCYAALC
jgi:hypothetical protein